MSEHASRATSPAILAGIFVALFVQVQFLLFFSLISYRPVTVVQRFSPQLDFLDFLTAARDWLQGLNPYLRDRFDKPPASMLVTLPLLHLSPAHAALMFFLANLAVLGASLAAICRHFRLSRAECLLLYGTASMYFPAIFLVERGNLDGIMLGLILLVLFAKHPTVRAAGLAMSVGIKLYSALLFAPLLRSRQWRTVGLALLLVLLLLAPFHALLLPFAHRQVSRTGEFHLTENISPALFAEVFLNGPLVRAYYYCLWLLSYVAMLSRRRAASLETQMVCSLPWMMALPVHVYAYTGVLLFPVLVLRSREIGRSSKLTGSDCLFLADFLFAGFQQTAWLTYFHQSLAARAVGSLANAAGTLLVMLSLAFGTSVHHWREPVPSSSQVI